MKKTKLILALTAVMAMLGSQAQAQDCCAPCAPTPCVESCECPAYCDSGCASYMSAALPIGALAIAAVIIATTGSSHHHHRSGNHHSSSSSSHAHYTSY